MLLSILAMGVEHEHDAFKKAKIGRDKGEEAMDYLEKKSLLIFDFSVEKPLKQSDGKSERLLFTLPFIRFWFALISPNYQSISAGDFSEFTQRWQELKANFSILLSNLLMRELVKESFAKTFVEDPIVSIGSYYDKQVHIEILAKRKSGKMLAGSTKYSQKKAKINMLSTLKQKCEKVELHIEDYVLFSKNGFSDEIVDHKEANLTLFTQEDLSSLLDDLTHANLLVYKNKKY